MSAEESNKFSQNLKVPPLKIVLTSHQNNAVMNVTSKSIDEKSDKDNNTGEQGEHKKESSRRSSLDVGGDEQAHDTGKQYHRKLSRATEQQQVLHNNKQANNEFCSNNLSSSSSTASDRSTSTTPSSESESLASNATIISDSISTLRTSTLKSEQKDDNSSKQDRVSRHSSKNSHSDRGTNSGHAPNTKRSQDSSVESAPDSNSHVVSREQSMNANQRITRSSQRAAQQNKSDYHNESIGEDSMNIDNQDKSCETTRKVKRRKGEIQESEPDVNQSATSTPLILAGIHPADYQLPSQNSFELYRDIRERPYKKMLELSHTQPKVPFGFKDYLINGGPYLLDGNKLGLGLNGAKSDKYILKSINPSSDRITLKSKNSSLRKKLLFHQPSQQRHSSYTIPKTLSAPKNLQDGSPLYDLFIDQEKARQQMRIVHLKERERSVLASEQEILRAYNRVAAADLNQKLHLSACTYFYYHERYHYLDGKSNKQGDKGNPNQATHSQDNSFLCIAGDETTKEMSNPNDGQANKDCKDPSSDSSPANDAKIPETNGGGPHESANMKQKKDSKPSGFLDNNERESDVKSKNCETKEIQPEDSNAATNKNGTCDIVPNRDKTKTNSSDSAAMDNVDDDNAVTQPMESQDDLPKTTDEKEAPVEGLSIEEMKILNKKVFLDQLQEIDDKWAKIRQDMWKRHKNEADSLFAVQSMEWEWKAKEIGQCDVRVSLKVDPELVPRVEVSALDY